MDVLAILSFLFLGGRAILAKSDPNADKTKVTPDSPSMPKLLVIMLDGFRWDYYDLHRSQLDAFEEFLSRGVRAEWVEPVFPSLSYPNWATLSNGLFPEKHGILGNYMFDRKNETVFDLDDLASTRRPEWWQTGEPIWISATRERRRVYLRYWSRADVPYHGTLPNGDYSGYRPDSGIGALQRTLNLTLSHLRHSDLLMVYAEHLDNVGHEFGPDSAELVQALKEVNKVFKWFLDELLDKYADVEKDLHIVIVSDHGMAESGLGANMTVVQLKDYLRPELVMKVIGGGGVCAIAPFPSHTEEVYEGLRQMEGVDVYRRKDIPEEFHYKHHRLVQEILLVARPGFHIKSLRLDAAMSGMGTKPAPPAATPPPKRGGSHGYANNPHMRAIFFARGPQFKVGITHPPIHMEDIYQVFSRVLGIPEQPHDGLWTRVSGMFLNDAIPIHVSSTLLLCVSAYFLLTFIF